MFELSTIAIIGICFAAFVVGILATMLFHKLRSGASSPQSLRNEMDNYQASVEAHFDETSRRFKDMTQQYQELYEHLSVGATTLCRPEQITHSLADNSDQQFTQQAKTDEADQRAEEDPVTNEPAAKPSDKNEESIVAKDKVD